MANTRTDLTTSLNQCAADITGEQCRIMKWVEIRNNLIRSEPAFRDCTYLMDGLVPGLCHLYLEQWISQADMLNRKTQFQELCKNDANRVWCEGKIYSSVLNDLTFTQRTEMDVCKEVFSGDRITWDACFTDIAKPSMDTIPSLQGSGLRVHDRLAQWYMMLSKSPEHFEAAAQWGACRRVNSGGTRSPVCAELLDSALPPLQPGQVCDAACQTNREAKAYRSLDAAAKARYAQCHELNGYRSHGYCQHLLVDGDSGIQEINDKCGPCTCCVRNTMLQAHSAAPADNKLEFQACLLIFQASPEGRCMREALKTALGITTIWIEPACRGATDSDFCNGKKLVDEFVKMPAAQQKQFTQVCFRPAAP